MVFLRIRQPMFFCGFRRLPCRSCIDFGGVLACFLSDHGSGICHLMWFSFVSFSGPVSVGQFAQDAVKAIIANCVYWVTHESGDKNYGKGYQEAVAAILQKPQLRVPLENVVPIRLLLAWCCCRMRHVVRHCRPTQLCTSKLVATTPGTVG